MFKCRSAPEEGDFYVKINKRSFESFMCLHVIVDNVNVLSNSRDTSVFRGCKLGPKLADVSVVEGLDLKNTIPSGFPSWAKYKTVALSGYRTHTAERTNYAEKISREVTRCDIS